VVPALLARGAIVTGLDYQPCTLIPASKNYSFIQKNISEVNSLAGFEYVIHLAFATSIPGSIQDPLGTTYNNIDLGIKILELAKQAGVKKLLYPSTASLYGNQALPWKEGMPVFPSEPYSLQKYTMERFCRYYAANGLPTGIFRLFQVFGENQRHDTALAKFFRCKKEGKPIPITQTADPTKSARRDFVYTGDIAEAFCLAIPSPNIGKGEIINIASGHTYTIREVAECISTNIEFIPKRGYDLDEHLADVSLAKELLGWTAKTDIKDWLARYVPTL
jgi:nucleoside-diphosphate-sugar epimerase